MTRDMWSVEDTDVWLLPEQKFYPTDIHVGHSQLRHLISSPAPNVIYFVDGRKVFCLDSKTSSRVLVTELPFKAMCTASGYGFWCAGGEEHGYFAAMRIPDERDQDLGHTEEDHLPDCIPSPPTFDHLAELYPTLPLHTRIERMGSFILNSISIHLLRADEPEMEDEVVAVLTNNDRTVRVVSLTRDVKELWREKFDFAMNHASISPDGKFLMIVGDKEVVYFYKRIDGSSEIEDLVDGQAVFQKRSWSLIRQTRLHKPSSRGSSAYFTTAWSSNGNYCATASENGVVTLMSARCLEDLEQDPVIAEIPSSRPNTMIGGVRGLTFAPDPWDLLLWNEDRGRMCMADIRNNLHVRQVNVLDPTASAVKLSVLVDPNMGLPGPAGLTDQELQILDGLRTTRQRQEQEASGTANAGVSPRSINYISPRNRQRLSNPPVLGSIRDYLREQNWNSNGETIGGTGGSTSRQQESRAAGRASLSQHRPTSSGPTTADAWDIIQAAMRGNNIHQTPTSGPETPLSDEEEATSIPVLLTGSAANPYSFTTLRNPTDPYTPSRTRPRHDTETNASRESRARLASSENPPRPTWRSPNTIYHSPTRTDAALRSHIAELEAEVDATERQLLRGNGTSTPTPPPDSGPSERELSERRRRLLAIAAVTEEVSAERRRRARPTSATGGFPNVMWYNSPRERDRDARERDPALTTRGEAALARQAQLEQQAVHERQRELHARVLESRAGPGAFEGSESNSERMRAAYDGSMQDVRRHGWMREEMRRRSRLAELSGEGDTEGVNNGAWKTTGLAWGGGRKLYVGIERGIFELTLDFSERKFWPAVDMR